MTARRRISDMVLPVDTASAWPERAPRSGSGSGIENEWLSSIRTPEPWERRRARDRLAERGAADIIDILGLRPEPGEYGICCGCRKAMRARDDREPWHLVCLRAMREAVAVEEEVAV